MIDCAIDCIEAIAKRFEGTGWNWSESEFVREAMTQKLRIIRCGKLLLKHCTRQQYKAEEQDTTYSAIDHCHQPANIC
jgi:hypothetical protein